MNEPTVPPFCAHLESKKVLIAGAPPLTERDVLDASQHCWCARTMQVLGPDRELVAPDACRKGRVCFESAFESML